MSFADPRAVQDIYGHKSSLGKDTFYDLLSGGDFESIVSTRNREEHAAKRRYISNAFSHRSIVSMEPLVADKVGRLVERLDLAAERNEVIDIRQWLNFFSFDVITDMAFGNNPDFLRLGEAKIKAQTFNGKKSYNMNPIKAFQDNTVHVASLGHWPGLFPITKFLTRWLPKSKRGDEFNDMCIQQVRERLKKDHIVSTPDLPHGDFFQHFLVDSKGQERNLPFWELVYESAIMLSAGSDTTASSMTNTLYLLMRHPNVLERLRVELHDAVHSTTAPLEADSLKGVLTYKLVSPLKYLRACLDEGLRHLPPTSIGLLRMTPPEGAQIAGYWIKGGVTASVPTYTLHHSPELFPDPWTYKPERWLEGSEEERQNLNRYVIPFTLGRHACLGRNIAMLEQHLVLSTLVDRYNFQFAEDGFELPVLERINANPGAMPVRLQKRHN